MAKKYIVLTVIIICLITLVAGCISEEETPKMVADLIFKNVKDVSFMYEFPKARFLNNNEINILKASIKDGAGLTTLSNNEMPNDFQAGYLYFSINKSSRSGVDIFYDKSNNYMFVRKGQVYQEKEHEYEQKLSLIRKYLDGIYRFHPSKEKIDRLINGN